MTDYSWVIGVILGGAVLVAFALMLFDWRRDTLKEDLRNLAITAAGCTGVVFLANAFHVRHADWLFGPVIGAVGALFSREGRTEKLRIHLTIIACSLAGMILQNAVDAYHLQRYQEPITLAPFFAAGLIIWSVRKSRSGIEPFGPAKSRATSD